MHGIKRIAFRTILLCFFAIFASGFWGFADEVETGSIYVSCGNTFITNASVYLDGSYQGLAPKNISGVTPGRHRVTLKKYGYSDVSEYVYVSKGNTSYATLKFDVANVRIETPGVYGVSVYLDGSYKGNAPLTISDLPGGKHRIMLTKEHYQTYNDTVYLYVRETSTLTVTMVKISGYLTVNKTPSNATAYVDGKAVSGTTELDEGTYNVRVRLFGYNDFSQSVKIERNKYHSVTASLSRAAFNISSFSANTKDGAFDPDAKNTGSIYFMWNVTAPETGTITVTDTSGAVLYSTSTSFTTWKQCIEWDGKVNGSLIPGGKYYATLVAGGYTRTSSFEISSKRTQADINTTLGTARVAIQKEITEDGQKIVKERDKAIAKSLKKEGKTYIPNGSGGTDTDEDDNERRTIFGYAKGRDGVYLETALGDEAHIFNLVGLYDFNKYFSVGPAIGLTIIHGINVPAITEGYNGNWDLWFSTTGANFFTLSVRGEAGIPLGIFYPYAFVGAGCYFGSLVDTDISYGGLLLSCGIGLDMRLISKHLALGLALEGNIMLGCVNDIGLSLVLGYHF